MVEYFSPSSKGVTVHDALRNASPVFDTDRMPIILQDDRHSRTIVGYEVSRDGAVKLLMFDPALSVLMFSHSESWLMYGYQCSERVLEESSPFFCRAFEWQLE